MEQRVIKFRGWVKGANVPYMASWHNFYRDKDAEYMLTLDDPDVIPMQYTGLKDKNGTEIYEGDLLSHKFYSWPVVVTFEHGRFSAEDVSMFSDSIEVIGNIYENPDLLETPAS